MEDARIAVQTGVDGMYVICQNYVFMTDDPDTAICALALLPTS
jgi:hypothetical protein